MEDIEIIELYFARSEKAVLETSKKYGKYLMAVAGNILRRSEDREEVINDVYLAAWNSIPPNRPQVLKFYLSKIARNLSLKRHEYLSAEKRSAKVETVFSELDKCIPDNHRDPAEIVEAAELGKYINLFLATLSEEDRGLFVFRYFYMMKIDKIAERCGNTQRQIKYRLKRLRENLKEFLSQEDVTL